MTPNVPGTSRVCGMRIASRQLPFHSRLKTLAGASSKPSVSGNGKATFRADAKEKLESSVQTKGSAGAGFGPKQKRSNSNSSSTKSSSARSRAASKSGPLVFDNSIDSLLDPCSLGTPSTDPGSSSIAPYLLEQNPTPATLQAAISEIQDLINQQIFPVAKPGQAVEQEILQQAEHTHHQHDVQETFMKQSETTSASHEFPTNSSGLACTKEPPQATQIEASDTTSTELPMPTNNGMAPTSQVKTVEHSSVDYEFNELLSLAGAVQGQGGINRSRNQATAEDPGNQAQPPTYSVTVDLYDDLWETHTSTLRKMAEMEEQLRVLKSSLQGAATLGQSLQSAQDELLVVQYELSDLQDRHEQLSERYEVACRGLSAATNDLDMMRRQHSTDVVAELESSLSMTESDLDATRYELDVLRDHYELLQEEHMRASMRVQDMEAAAASAAATPAISASASQILPGNMTNPNKQVRLAGLSHQLLSIVLESELSSEHKALMSRLVSDIMHEVLS